MQRVAELALAVTLKGLLLRVGPSHRPQWTDSELDLLTEDGFGLCLAAARQLPTLRLSRRTPPQQTHAALERTEAAARSTTSCLSCLVEQLERWFHGPAKQVYESVAALAQAMLALQLATLASMAEFLHQNP